MPRKPSLRVLLAIFVPALITGGAAVAAHSNEGKTEAQKARHEHYEELGDAFKAVRDNSRGDNPDWAALEKAAKTVVAASIDQQRAGKIRESEAEQRCGQDRGGERQRSPASLR